MAANRQEGRMSARLTHLFSLPLSVFPVVLWNTIKPRSFPLLWRVIAGAGTQRRFQKISPTRAGPLSWLTPQVMTQGAGHGCRSRWRQAHVRGHHNEEGAAAFPTAFPPWLVVVRTLKKHLISLIATPLTYQSKQVEQSSSLILKALLGNNVGISFMEKY